MNTSTLPPVTEMDRALRQRDASYDGIFFLGVRTTGIFCRPSCPARKPLAENVEFFSTVREALGAGYRPCKRCQPLHTDGRPPEWVEELLAEVEHTPALRLSDAALRQMHLDPARVRRHFLRHYGLTFQAYCRGRRMAQALGQIREGSDLDDVVLDHGYESHSGFREAFAQTFGRPPGKSRQTDCVVTTWIDSPLGPLMTAATAEGICLLEFTDRNRLETQLAALQKLHQCAIVPGESKILDQLKEELAQYFAGTRKQFTVPLVYRGTPFQLRVWNALRQIPYGETRSYIDLARDIDAPNASRAVGHTNGLNRVAIVIPCHRVVNKNGELGGYGGGLWRKRLLLDLEQTGKLLDSSRA
jgi:AraC family transcriptional regulator, regulatory protein of adaptative response / methylated-DNA-[protein]-cysteine methyltransferase